MAQPPIKTKKGSKQPPTTPSRRRQRAEPTGGSMVFAPASLGLVTRSSIPTFTGGKNMIRVQNREFVTSFSTGSAPVNTFEVVTKFSMSPGYGDACPGNSLSFPWLSTIAGNFEKYRFHKLVYHIYPSAATSQAGRVYASFEYDYDDPVPVSLSQLMVGESCAEASCWTPFSIKVDPRALNRDSPYRFISTLTRENYIEPRTSYAGYLVVAAVVPAVLTWDLHVEYDVELDGPTLDNQIFIDDFSSTSNVTVSELFPIIDSTNRRGMWHKPIAPAKGSPIKVVVPGQGNTPAMTGVIDSLAANTTPAAAYDLRGLEGKGFLQWAIDYASPSLTPANFDSNLCSLEIALCNADGKKLANLTQADPKGLLGYFLSGPAVSGTLATVGSFVRSTASLALSELMKSYPTAAYAVVATLVNQALGAVGGSYHSGTKVEV